ncbi:MAG TPA: hypothetical protein VHW90_14925 [Stellaceae bacterium]|nr:hypothetical protein [Stellaceae bacterium]
MNHGPGDPMTPRERLAWRFARAWKREVSIEIEDARQRDERIQKRTGQMRLVIICLVIVSALALFALFLARV